MPDLAAALDRQLLDVNGVMKEPVSGEALHLGEAIGRNLVIEVIVSREGVDRVTRISETFRLHVDSVHDTMTDRWLTLDSAVESGIVVAAQGEYVDRSRCIHMPLIDAVRDGLIQGRLLDVERKKEEVTRTGNESTLRMVDSSVRSSHAGTSAVISIDGLPLSGSDRFIVDPRTGLELSVKEAIAAGIYDAAAGELPLLTGRDEQVDEMFVQQTYSIGAVRDSVTGELISPSEAEATGLIDMARGIYILPVTKEAITLAEALERGLISAEPLEGTGDPVKTARASKVERGRMVFTIKSVKDSSTGEMVGADEAENRGILDTVKGLYIDSVTGKTMLLHEAYEAGLIEAAETVERTSSPVQSAAVSFSIVAVIDPRSNEELTVAEAVDRHLLDAAVSQFFDPCNNEVMTVEEAISRGYIIAADTGGPGSSAVMHDTQSYRIKSVIDPQTGEEIPIADAVRHKIVDKATGMYWNMKTDEMVPIEEAIHRGLVITEPVNAAVTKTAQWEVGDDFTKQMYVLTAVRDPRTGKEFDLVEAERRGLFNKLQRVYINPVTGEKIPVDEAIKRNLISFSEVTDADYDEENMTIEMTRQVKGAADITPVWDPVSGQQVLLLVLSPLPMLVCPYVCEQAY